MRILIMGGTAFVGRHIAQAAIDAGHDVTLFHRGRTGADGNIEEGGAFCPRRSMSSGSRQ